MNIKRNLRGLLLATILSGSGAILVTQPALAFDAGEFVGQIEQQIKAQGGTFTYEKLSEGDGQFTLDNVKFRLGTGNNETLIEIATTTYRDVREEADGNLLIGGLSADGYRHTIKSTGSKAGEVLITAKSLAGESLRFSNDAKAPVPDIGKIELSDIEIRSDGRKNPVFLSSPGIAIDGFSFESENSFEISNVTMQPLSGSSESSEGPISFGFEGFSLRAFERLSKFGFNIDGFELGAMNFNGIGKDNTKIAFSFGGMTGNNIYVPDAADPNQSYAWTKPFEAEAGPFLFSYNGKEIFGWDGGSSRFKSGPKSDDGGWQADIREAYLDLGATPVVSQKDRANLELVIALGYERLIFSFLTSGFWDPDSGIMAIDQYRVDMKGAGAVEIGTEISGYTENFARTINQLSNQMNAEKDPKKREAMSLQLLASMAGLSFNQMRVSIEDASLLQKLLKLQSEQSARQTEELLAMVGPMVAISLAPYNVPEFASAVADALNTFMQGEKTITATMKPEGGLAVTEMLALGSGVRAGTVQPAELIERLNLKVTAE